jgi:hypothetical protein
MPGNKPAPESSEVRMSAAFSLDYSGAPVPCDFRGCILEAWHDGEHQFPKPINSIQWSYDRHCVVCGVPFTVISAAKCEPIHTCGEQACLLHYAQRYSFDAPLLCRCPQREHPHELSVHALIRSEWWKRELRTKWPWSLMASLREEPSTERKAA